MEARESNIWVLGEELMVEILTRVGRAKCAVRCKLVCKFWCSLVVYNDSDSHWLRRWHQINPNKEAAVVSLFTDYGHLKETNELSGLRYESQPTAIDCDDKSINMKLDFLPCNPVCVVDFHKDLLLCSGDIYDRRYYLCNPLTRQWTALPPPPPGLPHRDATEEEEMHFSEASKVRFTTSRGRLAVVRVIPFHLMDPFHLKDYQRQVRIWVLVLDRNGKWTEVDNHDLLGLFPRRRTCKKILSYRGKMVWIGKYSYKDDAGLFSYDFDSNDHARLPLVVGFSPMVGYHTKSVIGVCEGRLRIAQLIDFFSKLVVWELDDERGEWVMVRELRLREAGRGSREWRRFISIHSRLEEPYLLVKAMAFHPEDRDILYMLITMTGGEGTKAWSSHLFSCNIRKTKLDHIRTFPAHAIHPKIFPVVEQSWPTPVPEVISNSL